MYTSIDTPNGSTPPLMPRELLPIVWKIVEDVKPEIADRFFSQALNHRLGVSGQDITTLTMLAAE